MSTEPLIVERSAQPYMAIKGTVTMQTVAAIADRLPEVFGWLGAHGIEPVDAPFFKYNLIDMQNQLEIEVGVPVAATAPPDGDVFPGVLPAGRYVTLTHVGHPKELRDATAELLAWAERQGLEWDMSETGNGQTWAARLEVYKTDPAHEPDMTKWETDLVFRVADYRD